MVCNWISSHIRKWYPMFLKRKISISKNFIIICRKKGKHIVDTAIGTWDLTTFNASTTLNEKRLQEKL